ncbi:hypothetical protein BTJ49_03250 [Oleiagrimonas sp. MCCC 1A03011]|nr:hypothetical protein BTJ49_03250 [Oleiagrimonas sp. MCCC 1A03011]
MIFARRAIQNRLDQLRTTLGDESIQKLAGRLNTPGKDRLAAMWEVVTFHGLSKLGILRDELPLETGRKPDIHFKSNDLEITADVTTVSDDGLHEINPAQKLQELIYEQQVKLGLPDAGMKLDIDYREERSNRGVKTKLCLPPVKRLPELVRNEIVPKLKEQIDAGARVLHVPIKNETTSLRLIIDPSKPTFSTMSYASYTSPSIRDKNPLYEALKAKAKQLRKAPGIVGVIVGDSATGTLEDPMTGSIALTGRAIAEEFLRQHSSVDFVLLITVREEPHTCYQAHERKMWLEADLVPAKTGDIYAKLETLFRSMLDAFPIPVNMPINASHRAKESGFGWGYHGGFRMSGKRARFSAREILEVLAGQRTAEEINEQHKALHGSGHSISMPQWIDAQLRAGRLPSSMSIIKTDENENDDWIEFEFGPPDAAITPFR